MSPTTRLAALVSSAAALALLAGACTPPAGTTTRVSSTPTGGLANGPSGSPAITPDGRFVVFESQATNLGGGPDAGRKTDVFLRDRRTGAIERISVDEFVGEANDDSILPSVSDDASRVVFTSFATNLGGQEDGNLGDADVYVRDRATGLTHLVSRSTAGVPGDGSSSSGVISGDGRFVAFESNADNLVPADTNGAEDVFVHDLLRRTTRRVSLTGGAQIPGGGSRPDISREGSRVAFVTSTALVAEDDDAAPDAYVWDRATGQTTFVGLRGVSPSLVASVAISGDGRFVAFISTAGTDRSQVFVKDLGTGQLLLVSRNLKGLQSNGGATSLDLSADGGHVAFSSRATDLVAGDTNDDPDVFLVTRQGTGMRRISVRTDGSQVDLASRAPAVADGGRLVAFDSEADFAGPDDGVSSDVFVRQP